MAETRLPASFRGVKFWVESSDVSAGRRTVTHQFPQRDKPYTEDLGRAAREYNIEAFVLGDDCLEQAKKLQEALEKPGAATLVHPELGELQVVANASASMSFSQQKRTVRFSLSFVEAGLNAFPNDEGASQGASRSAVDSLISSAIDNFADSINLDGIEDFVQDALNGDILDALGIISNADIAKVLGFADRVSELATDAIGLVSGGPKAFAQKLMGALGLSGLATTVAGWQRVGKALSSLVDDLKGDKEEPSWGPVKASSSKVIEQNRQAVYALCRQGILAQAVGVSTLIGTRIDSTVISSGIISVDEGTSASSSSAIGVTTSSTTSATGGRTVGSAASAGAASPTVSYDEMIEVQAVIIDALEEEMMKTDNDAVFLSLRQAATAISQDLTTRAQGQARLYDHDAGAVLPAAVTAMDLYGDAERAQEIAIRNGVAHPLFCPNVLKVLNE